MADPPGTAALYLQAQQSFAATFRSLSADERALEVPSCPGWTVRDVLSHVAGVTDDLVHGRTDGVATDRWTAAQVARWRDVDAEELLAQWDAQTPAFAQAIEAIGERRPPIDCHAHEHDVRGAVKRPGNRDSAIVEQTAERMVRGVATSRPLRVELTDGRVWRGGGPTGDPLVLRGVTPYELFRSLLGRRSLAQVAAYDWSDDPSDALARWFWFGPSATDIDDD
jgi:uncharacterized protein (TIGR03083 family)